MKHVFALFSDGAAAENAVKKLADSGFDTKKAEIHSQDTIKGGSGTPTEPAPNIGTVAGAAGAGVAGDSGMAGGGAAVGGVVLADNTIEGYLSKIGVDSDAIPFYMHGLKEDGHVVGIDVANEDAQQAQSVLTDAGGQIPQAK